MKNLRLLIKVAVIGAFPVIVCLVVLEDHLKSLQTESVDGGDYEGQLPGLGRVRFHLFFDEGQPNGWFDFGGSIRPDWVDLTIRSSNNIHAELVTGDGEWATNGTMDFTQLKGGEILEGVITLISNGPSRPFTFNRTYQHRAVKRSSGLILGRIGADASFIGEYPLIPATTPFRQELGRAVARAAAVDASKETTGNFPRKWDILLHGRWPHTEHFEQYWQPVYVGDSLASLAIFNYPDYGGNGNPTYWSAKNYYWTRGRIRQFELADLFRPGTPWRAELRNLCAQDLRRDGTDPERANMRAQALLDEKVNSTIFTVTPDYLRIYYNPYELDSGAAGSFILRISWDRLRTFLDTNGPAAALERLESK